MPHSVDWAVALLKDATSVEEIELILRGSVRPAVQADGATVVRREADSCYYAEEDAIAPLWKGQRFPLNECISGWAMLNRETVTIPDIRVDSRIPQRAYRPTFVRSLVMVPIGAEWAVAAIGAYWADGHQATPAEIGTLERLAAAAAGALRGVHSAGLREESVRRERSSAYVEVQAG
jgi:GAF domain-containing protein